MTPRPAPLAQRAWAAAAARWLRSTKRLVRPGWMARLAEHNASSADAVVAPGGPVVSLTTYGPRLADVHYTIESIGQGDLKPSRLILWLAHELLAAGLPLTLQRLQRRGLEVVGCDDHGPHKKYFPYVMTAASLDVPLVTADDDHLYPRHWLARLQRAHRDASTDAVHCWRAHRIAFDGSGGFMPYRQWPGCTSLEPSALHFTTGASGVMYPPRVQAALREHGAAFTACCPRADDIWLNANALRAGVPVVQVAPLPVAFFELPGSRDQGLARSNVGGGGNDLQLAATYTAQERARLWALARG